MALKPIFSWLLLLVTLNFFGNNNLLTHAEKQLLFLKDIQWVERDNSRSCLSQKSRAHNGAAILELKHIDSCSGPIQDSNQKLEKRLISDSLRVKSIQSHIRNALSSQIQTPPQAQIPVNSGIKLHTLNYIATITLGNRSLTVIVDTGSDLTWVQCQPCTLCYTQPEPLFNPLISPSYRSVPCSAEACNTLHLTTGNSGLCRNNASTCNYVVTYGDGSYTRGELGRDRLVLGTSSVDGFMFGCGRNNKGLFGSASGLMGLGRSDLSLVSQTADSFNGVFSYCLPDSDSSASGSLIFGNDVSAFKNSTPVSYTRLMFKPQLDSFYILNITGTSVGGVELQSPSFGQNGILIDSGTVITRLPPSLYGAVKTEFLKQFSGYPSAPSFSILETCFNLTGYEEVDIPTLRFRFEDDAEMVVDVSGMFYFVKRDASHVCLALASLAYESGIGIIGNYQQRNTRVVYDTKQMRLGFARETCSF